MESITLSGPEGLLALAARATLLLLAALLFSRALRGAAAVTRHVLWTATFVLLLGLPIGMAWLPAWELPLLPVSGDDATPVVVGAALPGSGTGGGAAAGRATVVPGEGTVAPGLNARSAGPGAAGRGVAGASSRAGSPADPSTSPASGDPGGIPLALLLWAIGSAAAMASVTVGTLRFRALVRDAEPVRDPVWLRQLGRLRLRLGIDAEVRLLRSTAAHTPMTGGWHRPVVVLPGSSTTWTPERREVVLLHELVHVRRHDALRQLLGQAALSLYWFHPLSWIASRQAAVSREQACDETVLALGTRPSEYAGHLLALAEGMHVEPALGSLPMIQPSQLERRIMAILAPHRPRASALGTCAVLFLIGGLGLSAAVAHPVEGGPQVVPATVAVHPVPASPGSGEHAPRVAEATPPRAPERAAITRAIPPLSGATLQEEPSCRSDRWSGSFDGTISITDDGGARRQERAGWQNGDRLIQRYVDDVRLCMRIHGDVVMSDEGDEVRAIGRGGWVVLESEDDGLQRLVITEDAAGIDHAFSVDGRERPFDDRAREWRNHMFTVLGAYWEASRLRGQESSLRGRISSHRGHISSLRGRMSSARGHISSLRGQISSAGGHVSSLRGRISSLRGRLSSLNGQISSHRGQISSLRSALRATENAGTRARLEEEMAVHEARIREVEREIEAFGVDDRVADVEEEIAEYDLDARVRRLEAEIADYDLDTRLREIEREIAEYDLDGKVRALEAEIEALDADRRAEELERSVESDVAALRRLIDGS